MDGSRRATSDGTQGTGSQLGGLGWLALNARSKARAGDLPLFNRQTTLAY